MRIGFDATPAAVQVAGVGRYTRELLHALMPLNSTDQYRMLCLAQGAATDRLLASLPPGASRTMRRLPVSDRVMTAGWHRLRLPIPVEWLVGDINVYHGPDFVAPPTRAASVVTIHDLSFLVRPDLGDPRLVAYLRNVVPRALASADQIIAVSGAVAEEIVERFPTTRERVRAIPNGVRPPVAIPEVPISTRPVVLIVGTIEPRKNHLGLVEAMQHVRMSYPDAILHVAGRVGWRSDDIMRVLRKEENAGHVILFDGPTDEQLDELYAGANVFVYPSWYEGFGLPVLEAMTRQVPVIASDIAVLREAGGDAALYTAPAEAESIGSAISQVLGDSELARQLGTNGALHASRFSWRDAAIATREVYEVAARGAMR